MTLKTLSIALVALSLGAAMPTMAQDVRAARTVEANNPNGTFVDSYGTSFTFSECGEGAALCGVLNDIGGKSRTPENLAFVGQQVMQAEQTAPNEWKGTVIFGGSPAAATVTQTGPDSIEIQGCRGGILCQTLEFNRT